MEIGFEELDVLMEGLDEEAYLYYKLSGYPHDIRGVSSNYLAGQIYYKRRTAGCAQCRTVPESELLKRSVVVLDGFTGFTPVQNRLLAELMKLARDVIVTVTIDDERRSLPLYAMPVRCLE